MSRIWLSEPADFTAAIEARDFLAVYLPRISEKQRRALLAWAAGRKLTEIAEGEGTSVPAIHDRVAGGLRRLRMLAAADEDKAGAVGRLRSARHQHAHAAAGGVHQVGPAPKAGVEAE